MQVKKNDKPIKEVLQDFVQQKKINPGYYNAKILLIWKEKMGLSINQYTRSIKFYNGKLYLVIDSAPLKHELLLNKQKLIDLLNKELGTDIITDINFK